MATSTKSFNLKQHEKKEPMTDAELEAACNEFMKKVEGRALGVYVTTISATGDGTTLMDGDLHQLAEAIQHNFKTLAANVVAERKKKEGANGHQDN